MHFLRILGLALVCSIVSLNIYASSHATCGKYSFNCYRWFNKHGVYWVTNNVRVHFAKSKRCNSNTNVVIHGKSQHKSIVEYCRDQGQGAVVLRN